MPNDTVNDSRWRWSAWEDTQMIISVFERFISPLAFLNGQIYMCT